MSQGATFELNKTILRDGEIVLYQRPDHAVKKWQCRVRVPNAVGYVVKSTKTTDLDAAKRFAQNLWDELRLKVMGGGAIKSHTFDDVYPKFCDWLKVNVTKERRYKDITSSIERYALKYFFKKHVDQIGTKEVQEFVQWRIKNPVFNERNNKTVTAPSPETIRHELASLKRMFDWMRLNRHIKHDVELKPPPLTRNRRPHFTKAEWNRITRNMREWVKDPRQARDRMMLTQYMLILVNTGIRIGEARTLKWSDIDSQTRMENGVEVEDIILSVGGKTERRDVVAKSADVKEYLGRIWELRKAEVIEATKNDLEPKTEPSLSEPVFANKNGQAILSLKKGFESFLNSMGLHKNSDGSNRTLYSLRHTYATFRLSHGVDVYKLAQNMGTSVEMIERHYGHTTNRGNASDLTRVSRSETKKRHAWE
jgi:integrase